MNDKILKENPFYLDDEAIKWVKDTVSSMTEEELIQQVFCVEVRSDDKKHLENIAENYQMGAVMCLPAESRDMYDMIRYIQEKSKIPMLVAGNLEEGADAIHGAVNVANNLEIGATGDAELAGRMGEVIGEEAGGIGMNCAFAPVIDIGMNWRNPVIATRVFSSDPEFVAEAGEFFIKGLQTHGMAAVAKHFPGDGVDERDQHFSPSVNSLSCEEWDQTYGKAYERAIDAGVLTVMAGHILQPAWAKRINPDMEEKDMRPASTSRELIQGLLREHLGFNGMISTDSTTMTGFDQIVSRDQAIPLAIEAGCDMILFSKDIEEDLSFLRNGIREGIVSRERLEEAVTRILGVKAALGLYRKKQANNFQKPYDQANEILGKKEHLDLEQICAKESVTLVKEEKGVLPLSAEKNKRIYLFTYAEGRGFGSSAKQVQTMMKEKLEEAGFSVTCHDPSLRKMNMNFQEMKEAYDLILYVSNLNSISNKAVCRLDWSPTMGESAPDYIGVIPTVFISFGNPYHLADVPRMKTYINAYKFKEATVDAVIRKLMGQESFCGRSPVDPFCGFWDARL